MENLTTQLVQDIDVKIAKEADSIHSIVYRNYNNDVIVKFIKERINNINELLEIRTKLLK